MKASTVTAVMRLVARTLDQVATDELRDVQDAADFLGCAVFAERREREAQAQKPRGRGGLRLVAEGGTLLPAGVRSLRARKAARARWRRLA